MPNLNKQQIIESLYKIMCSGTSTVSDSRVSNNDYFKRRVLGFKSEIEFEECLTDYTKLKFLEGGQFISKKLSGIVNDKNSFIYTTLSFEAPDDYENVYKTISQWEDVEELIYIKIELSGWVTESFETRNVPSGDKNEDEILKPKYIFYTYNKEMELFEKNTTHNFNCVLSHFNTPNRSPSLFNLRKRDQFDYFNSYSLNVLKKIYANRYFLDVVMRQAQGRQIIDLDGFIESENSLTIVEVKEKTPIKNTDDDSTWQYGWDSRRILWYLHLANKIKLNILYNVHQINNRNDRNFIQWDSIYIEDFLKGVSWSNSRGGGGGEDTLLAPYSFFLRLKSMLDHLESE